MEQKELSRMRSMANRYGALLCGELLTVERNSHDAGYSKKLENGKYTSSMPFYLYTIKRIPISEAKLVLNDINGNSYVYFNGDPKINLSLSNVKDIDEVLRKPTPENVKRAIEQWEATNGNKITYFVDYKGLVEAVKAANNGSKANQMRLIEELTDGLRVYDATNDAEETRMKNALGTLDPESFLNV